jgi:multiple sugar transport system substrate-binding protein
VLEAPGFDRSTPYAKVFLDSMKMVKDFWAEPSYAQLLLAMQKRTHDYVVANKGTPQDALNGLEKDWEEVFRDDGKLK